MKHISQFTWMVSIPALILSILDLNSGIPHTIKRIVVQPRNFRHIHNAHILILSSEEEAITKDDERFELKTWQSLPFQLKVEHPNYSSAEIVAEDTDHKFLLSLQAKK